MAGIKPRNKYQTKNSMMIAKILFLFLIFLFISCGDEGDCWVCYNGKCPKCNGKGYIKVDTNVCVFCKGTGKCPNCQGTGKINPNRIF
jgi:hypothetical protein